MTTHAEISIIPLPAEEGTSLGKHVAAAFEAISRIDGIRSTLTPLGTQIVAPDLNTVLGAVTAAHSAAKAAGAKRIISSIKIDERLDKDQTFEDKMESVTKRIKHKVRRGA